VSTILCPSQLKKSILRNLTGEEFFLGNGGLVQTYLQLIILKEVAIGLGL
jgi:hypothetical protein